MARILVFGGTFNPPTLAHQQIIARCLQLPGFDRLWVMPSNDRTDKQSEATAAQRLAMLHRVRQAFFQNEPRLRISEFEVNLNAVTRTSQTVAALHQAYPHDEFWFVFGSDSYHDMPNWTDGRRLQANLNLVIVSRGGRLPARRGIIVITLPDHRQISSNQLRQVAGQGGDISALVSPPVKTYIETHRLYRVVPTQAT